MLKLQTLRRIRKIVTREQAKLIAKALVKSQFQFASLIWMFKRKNLMQKMNKYHRITLRVV